MRSPYCELLTLFLSLHDRLYFKYHMDADAAPSIVIGYVLEHLYVFRLLVYPYMGISDIVDASTHPLAVISHVCTIERINTPMGESKSIYLLHSIPRVFSKHSASLLHTTAALHHP